MKIRMYPSCDRLERFESKRNLSKNNIRASNAVQIMAPGSNSALTTVTW